MREFNYDTINRYLDRLMTEEEARAFEQEMQQDQGLKEEVELLKDVNETLRIKLHPGENELALRKTLEDIRTESSAGKKEQAKVIPFRRRTWMYAAAAVFVAGILFTVWFTQGKEDLFEQYASIQMPATAERGEASDSLMKKASADFNNKRFAEAIPAFEALLKDDPQNSFAQYYYAITLLQNDQTERSRVEFTRLYNGVSLFRYDAAFYIALGYLKEKDKDNCRLWLNKIPADAGVYGKAQELLKKL